jgi:GNAT superfamily N-acetyltransferase
VVGFVTTGPNRDGRLVAAGEVLALYVAPWDWRSGAGTMLMGKAEEELRADGCHRAALWVFEANDRGRAFNEVQGWRADGAADTVSIGDQALAEVRYQKEFGARPV